MECPDGGIGWQGVFMQSHHYKFCAAWDSMAARLGLQECSKDRKTCTKLTARHLHMMSDSAGILVMKRMKCDEEGCAVFKVTHPFPRDATPSGTLPYMHELLLDCFQAGKCFDVGVKVFSSKKNTFMLDTLGNQTQEWASLVVSQLKAGTATPCYKGKDPKIATAGILGY